MTGNKSMLPEDASSKFLNKVQNSKKDAFPANPAGPIHTGIGQMFCVLRFGPFSPLPDDDVASFPVTALE